MKILLLGHSFVGAGVLEALLGQGMPPFLAATYYGTEEERVPCPNLARSCRAAGIPVRTFFPDLNFKDKDFPEGDLLICASWRHKISQELISRYTHAVGFHGCDLLKDPQFKGRRPIQRQIEAGRHTYTLSLFNLTDKIDGSEVLYQRTHTFPWLPSESLVYMQFHDFAKEMTECLLARLTSPA